MLSTFAANSLQTVFYTYTGSIVFATIVMLAIVYALRDVLGGVVIAAVVYYLYTM